MSTLKNLSIEQQLMSPDKLAYDLKLIPTPEKLSQQSKNKLLFYGIGIGFMIGIFLTTKYFENEKKVES